MRIVETVLTPSSVKAGSFGKRFALSVDGQIYAQPLYLRNVTIAGKGTHNVVYAATMHNTVYAFDSDTPGVPLWSVNLGPSVPTSDYDSDEGPYSDILPENGVLSTPVIDPATGTVYVVAATPKTVPAFTGCMRSTQGAAGKNLAHRPSLRLPFRARVMAA